MKYIYHTRLICKFFSLLLALFALNFLVSCSSEPESPEEQIRDLIEKSENAAENRNFKALSGLLSETYRDSKGRDKLSIEAILRFYYIRNKSIHLLTRINTISFPEPTQANVILFVAMAGKPIPKVKEFTKFRVDLHRFDIMFVIEEDNSWKVKSVLWRQANPEDFL